MPIVKNDKELYVYKVLDENDLKAKIEALTKIFDDYIKDFAKKHSSIFQKSIMLNETLLRQVLIRVDQRKEYFHIFHELGYCTSIKEAALLAYWISKLKPFSVNNNHEGLIDRYKDTRINDGFAIHLILSAIKSDFADNGYGKKLIISDAYIGQLDYAFKHWELSKEALMLVAESLCEGLRNKGK